MNTYVAFYDLDHVPSPCIRTLQKAHFFEIYTESTHPSGGCAIQGIVCTFRFSFITVPAVFKCPSLFNLLIGFVWALFPLLFFFFLRATPKTYGGSEAWGQIPGVATSLHHSHSNRGSEPHLQPTLMRPAHQLRSQSQRCRRFKKEETKK